MAVVLPLTLTYLYSLQYLKFHTLLKSHTKCSEALISNVVAIKTVWKEIKNSHSIPTGKGNCSLHIFHSYFYSMEIKCTCKYATRFSQHSKSSHSSHALNTFTIQQITALLNKWHLDIHLPFVSSEIALAPYSCSL